MFSQKNIVSIFSLQSPGRISRSGVCGFNTAVLLLMASFISCTNHSIPKEKTDTPVSGEIFISVDETFGPIMQEEKFVFESDYDSTEIHLLEKPEAEVVDDFMKDRSKMIVIPRKLNEDELSYFRKIRLIPQQTYIAIDALAFILNNKNTDTTLTSDLLESILSGKIKHWNEVTSSSKLADIQIVFDNKKSSTVNYIQTEILKGQPLPANCYATNDNKSVMSYVAANENAIGVIGVNWISNSQDSSVQSFLKTFKVVAVSSLADPRKFVQPLQVQLSRRNYPYMREVYIISRETHTGLGTGFASFVAGDRGQVIISRSGLFPSRKSLRMIEVKDNFD